MRASGVTCAECGAAITPRGDGSGRLRCPFCSAPYVARLEPGARCADRGAGACTNPARTLCRGCGAPLCDRHDNPRDLFWSETLDPARLLPEWDPGLAGRWRELTADYQNFPVSGFEPFPWTPHLARARQALGALEDAMRASFNSACADWGGEALEESLRLLEVCGACHAECGASLREAAARFSEPYRDTAYLRMHAALREETRQQLRYVEALLGRSLPPAPPLPGTPLVPPGGLTPESAPDAWERTGMVLKMRDRALGEIGRRWRIG